MKPPGSLDLFHKRIRILRKLVPARFPVKVRTAHVPDGDYGDTDLVRSPHKHFLIRINPVECKQCRTDTLIHEWGHALAWSESHPSLTAHDEVWGIMHSRAYRAIHPDD
jgi:hypothetical protein